MDDFNALIRRLPVVAAALGFHPLPGNRIAEVSRAGIGGALEILTPLAVVLCPDELIHIQMGKCRTLDANPPNKGF